MTCPPGVMVSGSCEGPGLTEWPGPSSCQLPPEVDDPTHEQVGHDGSTMRHARRLSHHYHQTHHAHGMDHHLCVVAVVQDSVAAVALRSCTRHVRGLVELALVDMSSHCMSSGMQ